MLLPLLDYSIADIPGPIDEIMELSAPKFLKNVLYLKRLLEEIGIYYPKMLEEPSFCLSTLMKIFES